MKRIRYDVERGPSYPGLGRVLVLEVKRFSKRRQKYEDIARLPPFETEIQQE